MASRIKKLQDRKAALIADMKALLQRADDEERDLSEQEESEYKAAEEELGSPGEPGKPETATGLYAAIAREERLQNFERTLRQVSDRHGVTEQQAAELKPKTDEKPKDIVPIHFKRHASLRNFKGPDAELHAYKSGLFFLATVWKDDSAREKCRELGMNVDYLAQSSGSNTAGGYLVPDELSNVIVDLREQYGVFRRQARLRLMGSDTLKVPRRKSGVTAYFVGENSATTESEKSWDAIELVAKELAALTLYPRTLAEDAIINLADDLAQEIAYAFAMKEDQCGFIGDGTSTYGGITGAAVRIDDGTHTASVHTAAAGNTAFDTLDLADFHGVVGKLPLYARMNAKWYISAPGYANSMERLMYAGGGNTVSTIGGGSGPSFLGYPVEFVQVMNSTLGADANAIKCLFGDLRLAASMGSRREIMIDTSTERYFELRQIAIQGTERIDINVHDLGDNSNPGPLVALKTPGS